MFGLVLWWVLAVWIMIAFALLTGCDLAYQPACVGGCHADGGSENYAAGGAQW